MRIVELEAAHHDLGEVGLELVAAEDVDGQEAAGELGLGQRVGERVAVLAGDGLVLATEADHGLVALVDDGHVGRRVRGRGDHIGRHAEVVRDHPHRPVACVVAEVLVEGLGDPERVRVLGRFDDRLERVEALAGIAVADHAERRQSRRSGMATPTTTWRALER